jgi:hypothetical protein
MYEVSCAILRPIIEGMIKHWNTIRPTIDGLMREMSANADELNSDDDSDDMDDESDSN